MKVVMGIDVSSRSLDACISDETREALAVKRFAYTPQGCGQLIRWAGKHGVEIVVMEASGGYERDIAIRLHGSGMKVHVVNPRQIHDFTRGMGQKAKTDRLDAKAISIFALKAKLPPAIAFSPLQQELKSLILRRIELKSILHAEKNRTRLATGVILKSLQSMIAAIEIEVKKIDLRIAALEMQNEDVADKACVLRRQKGIGDTSALTLLGLVPELGLIDRRRIASLLGLAPFANDSGKLRGKRFITGGRFEARRALYMPAWVATKYDPDFQEFYQRLIKRGKKPKVAIVAVMRKLLVRLNAMMRDFLQNEKMATENA
jgi:transposase